ncbi:MAG: thioredoxin [Candidatus Rifleibacteriota bacterium]
MAKELDSKTFQTEIIDAGSAAVVDFWAPWCGPCRMMTPIIDSLSKKFEGKVVIAKVNVDNNPDLAAKFNVASIPTIIFFKGGKAVHTVVGVVPEAELEAQINSSLL